MKKVVSLVLVLAMVLACLFHFLPLLNRVSGGFVIIICTILAAGLMAWLMPIEEEPDDV